MLLRLASGSHQDVLHGSGSSRWKQTLNKPCLCSCCQSFHCSSLDSNQTCQVVNISSTLTVNKTCCSEAEPVVIYRSCAASSSSSCVCAADPPSPSAVTSSVRNNYIFTPAVFFAHKNMEIDQNPMLSFNLQTGLLHTVVILDQLL